MMGVKDGMDSSTQKSKRAGAECSEPSASLVALVRGTLMTKTRTVEGPPMFIRTMAVMSGTSGRSVQSGRE